MPIPGRGGRSCLRQTPFGGGFMSNNARRAMALTLMLVMAIASSARGIRGSCCGESSATAESSCCAEPAESHCPLCGPRCPCASDAFSGCCCCQSTTALPAVLTATSQERWDELLQDGSDRLATALVHQPLRIILPAIPDRDHPILPSAMVLFCAWLN